MKNELSLKEASEWASDFLGREITASNISYLIQYARIKKYMDGLTIKINTNELKDYYNKHMFINVFIISIRDYLSIKTG